MEALTSKKWAIVNDKKRQVSMKRGKISWTSDRAEAELLAKSLGKGFRVVDAEEFAKNPKFKE